VKIAIYEDEPRHRMGPTSKFFQGV
jgi:hypothetical protein